MLVSSYLSGDHAFPAGNRPITRSWASCRAKISGQKATGMWNFSRGPRGMFSILSRRMRKGLWVPSRSKWMNTTCVDELSLPEERERSTRIGWLAGFWKSTFAVELTPVSVCIITGACCFWGRVPTPFTVYLSVPSYEIEKHRHEFLRSQGNGLRSS